MERTADVLALPLSDAVDTETLVDSADCDEIERAELSKPWLGDPYLSWAERISGDPHSAVIPADQRLSPIA